MLLKSLRLNNIRSYIDETIVFPEGKVLLAGDIGAGKSTILLGIEFALFGMKRGIISGDHILRHGTDFGVVSLSFDLGGNEVVINRPLKRTKNGIKQEAGYFIINGMKTDATPVELRAKMLELLGYPGDVLNKANDSLYRYTVFTPQEEMKAIFHASADSRLDTLRKIFNLDKYKVIRENAKLVLREMKVDNKVLLERVNILSTLEMKKEQLLKEIVVVDESLNGLHVEKGVFSQQLLEKKSDLDALEKQLGEKRLIEQEVFSLENEQRMLQEKKEKIERQTLNYSKQITAFEEELLKINLTKPGEESEEFVLGKIQHLKEDLHTVLEKKERLKRQKQLYDEQILQHIKGLQDVDTKLLEKESIKQEISVLTQGLDSKEHLLQEKQNLLVQRDTVMKGLAATTQIIQSCQELKVKISTLEHCPLCLQDVAHAHKEGITLQQNEKLRVAEKGHFEYKKREKSVGERLLYLERELTTLLDQEKKLFLQNNALQALERYEIEYVQKRMVLQSTLELLSTVENELNSLEQVDWSLKEKEVVRFETTLNTIRLYQHALKEKTFLDRSILDKKSEIQTLGLEKIDALEKERVLSHQLLEKKTLLGKYVALDELFTKEKESYEHILSLEREINLKIATLLSEKKMKEEYLLDTEKSLSTCVEARDQMERNKQFMHWFVELFQPLMLTIEKAVLLKIYHEFNAYFTEWFSILIDDDMITARLDDTFSPYVEQNGYETSFENLSGGEKTAVALAYRLALNKVINTFMVTITTKDFLILDEPTDGFSTEQLDKMREVLDQLDLKQILIVSHEHKIEAYVEHVLQIVKDGHVSSVLS